MIASVALLRFTINRLDALSVVLAVVVFLGAAATLAAGIGCLRAAPRGGPTSAVDPAVLVLGLAGAGLAAVAMFTNYDGFSSLWSELAEGESAEFVFEPAVLVVAILLGLGLLGGQPRVAAGLLLAVGTTTSLHYLGVLVAAWRAIGEVGEIKSAALHRCARRPAGRRRRRVGSARRSASTDAPAAPLSDPKPLLVRIHTHAPCVEDPSLMKIAVVGAGVSGLVAAHLLAPDHEVTVFEANAYAGGHTNTVRVDTPNETHWVDTGFIVFNDRNYPRFERLLDRLGVRGQASNMSFAVTDEQGDFEYASTSPNGLFAKRAHLATPWFHRMVADLLRFQREARALLASDGEGPSLGHFLEERKYSRAFVDRLIVPQAAAVWSADPRQMWSFPARFLIEFFANHGMLGFTQPPEVADGRGRVAQLRRGADRAVARPPPARDADRGHHPARRPRRDHAARRRAPSASTTSSSPPTPTRR